MVLPIDDKPIFQDDNIQSPNSTLIGTDISSNENPVIVVITDSTGGTYNDPADVPSNSSEWYTQDPDNSDAYIQIQFGASGDYGFVMPPEGEAMVQLINGIYDALPSEQVSAILPTMGSVFENAAINGDGGSIPGLAQLTGKSPGDDLDGDPNTTESIQSIVT